MAVAEKPKIIVILGPTASGKTELALKMARELNGEIISADSRQIYKKMDVATAKPLGVWRTHEGVRAYMVEGVPHYLMDIVDPGEGFSVAEFKRRALTQIKHILQRGKQPLIVGGTGLYIWSVVDNLNLPQVVPNQKLRRSLERKQPAELVDLLKSIDPVSARRIDLKNSRRLLRALEVAILTGASFYQERTAGLPLFDSLQVGINWELADLEERIKDRIAKQFNDGLIDETQCLIRQKYSWSLPSMSGIGYHEVASFLQGELTKNELLRRLHVATRRYAKRQLTWFRRDRRICWLQGGQYLAAMEMARKFLQKNDPV